MPSNLSIRALVCYLLITASMTHRAHAALATEGTQMMNNIQLLIASQRQLNELTTSIQQYQLMQRNARHLPDLIRSEILKDLGSLASIVQVGRSISYASARIDEDYRKAYKDYEYYNEQRAPGTRFSEQYGDWSQATHDSVQGALRAAKLQTDLFDDETNSLIRLQNMLMNAAGTMQALQAGGQVAALLVEQTQKLRQLLAAQIQLQAAHTASMTDRQGRTDAALDAYNVAEPTVGAKRKIIIGESVR